MGPRQVRLVCAAFLCEVLAGGGLGWRQGAAHFAQCLVDLDPAINANMSTFTAL
jgi:deoxyribodipyrimidine photolyase